MSGDAAGPGLGAIILAGGTGSRLGGLDKAALRPAGVAGPSLLERVVAALPVTVGSVVAVGGGATGGSTGEVGSVGAGAVEAGALGADRLSWTREDPPGSGPLAGIAAGLDALDPSAEVVFTLACDLPDLDTAALDSVLAALGNHDVALATDPDGREQYLLAAWRRPALEARLRALGDPRGLPVRRLLEGTDAVRVPLGAATADVDTWDDVVARGPLDVALLAGALSVLDPLAPHPVPVLDARGALASDLVAVDPMPRRAVSAMDGYAVSGPPPWALADGVLPAGPATGRVLTPGSAVAIATGAVAPAGTERVLRHELVRVGEPGRTDDPDATEAPDAPRTVEPLPEAAGVDDLRPVGEDWSAGAVLARTGDEVDAVLRSVALSGGLTSLTVRGPVRCRVVTSGNEIAPASVAAPPGAPPAEGLVRDTAGPVLPAVLRAAGMWCADDVEHVRDEPSLLREMLCEPGDVEVVALVGATGRGPADHLRGVLGRLGARIVLDGLWIRPGGSQLVAVLPGGRVLLALPGNPLAAVCAAALTGRVLVDALTGRVRREIRADLGEHAHPARTLALPARPGPAGWEVVPRPRTSHLADLVGSGHLACILPSGRATLLRVL